ncbi:MarR family winged helix-turn-helix transcriptional regulator [Actinacidiphila rubida]|uniref:DNA-binding transcriptional regulator, MarR family n=1 Tax=Actinacidiphila rubida TaxID=310780 RepID=A0A1H8JR55_9ACTN|nr:MarR family transcriptional regulator [Actinacidiphila rubida]SEN83169.1 DNA-binding transcriptional regulator, MarR family [Actinacidiphila rubida]
MESRTVPLDVAPAPDEAAAQVTERPDELTGRLADQLLGLSRRLHRAQRRLMEPIGVTPAQSRLLRVLSHCSEPPRMADVAQRLEVVPRAVTTLVDALEAGGLVRRVPDPHNRRVIRIELRDEGARVLMELRQARRTAAADLLAPLDDGQRAALTALLAVLDEEEPHPARG